MRLAELLSRTNDKLGYALICDDAIIKADGINRKTLYQELLQDIQEIHGRLKSDSRKQWLYLAITVFSEYSNRAIFTDDKEWCEMISTAVRYFRSAINNDPHKVDHFL